FLQGDALWQAAERGEWSNGLAAAAMATELGSEHPLVKHLQSGGKSKLDEPQPMHAILVDYRDGLRGVALKVGNSAIRWNFACQPEGDAAPRATRFHVGPCQNRNLFKALSHAIQTFFRQGTPPYPVERTLLTSGILDAAMDARLAGKPLDTPW